MARMEFLSANLLNTSTQLHVESNLVTAPYLFDRSVSLGYSSDGFIGATTTVISVEFDAATVLSHILIQNHNMKNFRLFYNSVTANSLEVITSNSATSSYFLVNSVTVSSIQLQIDATMLGTDEKQVGELVLSERLIQFERNPTQSQWNPTVFRKQIEYEMPDGGTSVFNVKDKYRTTMSWEFITSSFRDSLFSIYEDAVPLYFLPFPTTTGWDGGAYESVWTGDFDFKHATNDKQQGYSGSLTLKETPGR